METTVRRSPADLEAHLGYWMRRVSNHVSGGFQRALGERQVSVAEWVLLRTLLDRKAATHAELAEALGVTRGAVSKIVDKLEAKRWLKSRGVPGDGRVRELTLSAAGRAAVPVLASLADRNDEAFFGCLEKAERAALRRLLIKLAGCHQLSAAPMN